MHRDVVHPTEQSVEICRDVVARCDQERSGAPVAHPSHEEKIFLLAEWASLEDGLDDIRRQQDGQRIELSTQLVVAEVVDIDADRGRRRAAAKWHGS